ncbi:hypothetical protein F5148DRAFT_1146147 [Russula earlei]|uniref:Uncharacterized protein n=1 Tax=Russula earlei TaxID=71964 RepID=A0ACC0ULM1_9AGAM|nr:hypothetical protein F5148DRAFT_1146147 [Russula earlei]
MFFSENEKTRQLFKPSGPPSGPRKTEVVTSTLAFSSHPSLREYEAMPIVRGWQYSVPVLLGTVVRWLPCGDPRVRRRMSGRPRAAVTHTRRRARHGKGARSAARRSSAGLHYLAYEEGQRGRFCTQAKQSASSNSGVRSEMRSRRLIVSGGAPGYGNPRFLSTTNLSPKLATRRDERDSGPRDLNQIALRTGKAMEYETRDGLEEDMP